MAVDGALMERPLLADQLAAHDDRIDAVEDRLRRLDEELARIGALLAETPPRGRPDLEAPASGIDAPVPAFEAPAPGVEAPAEAAAVPVEAAAPDRSLASQTGSFLLSAGLVALALVFALAALPSLFGFLPLVVHGGSMGDAAPAGSLVLAKPLQAADIDVGDVIVVGNPGRESQFLHRVTRVEDADGKRYVLTKGDANRLTDPNWYQVEGAVPAPVHIVPWAGFGVALLSTPMGWFALVLLPGGLTCAACIRWIWSRAPQERGSDEVVADGAPLELA